MSVEEIGCCGAYCRTCRELAAKRCHGCKLGYQTGARDITKAKCKMKVCCLGKGYQSCADCHELTTCEIIQGFYQKKGYKYKKYQEALEYISVRGYAAFLHIADGWKNQYGKYS